MTTLRGLIVYKLPGTIYLAYLGPVGIFVGTLLWPVVALQTTLSVLLAHTWFF